MASRIKWSPRAVSDLESICTYIARDSERYAAIFANKVTAIIRNISDFPMSGRVVPEYGDEALREIIHKNYRIVYRLKDGTIEIVAICHGAKLLGMI